MLVCAEVAIDAINARGATKVTTNPRFSTGTFRLIPWQPWMFRRKRLMRLSFGFRGDRSQTYDRRPYRIPNTGLGILLPEIKMRHSGIYGHHTLVSNCQGHMGGQRRSRAWRRCDRWSGQFRCEAL